MIRRFRHRQPGRGGRPRVVLVDDHPHVLSTVGAMLASEVEVVGTAADGIHALEVIHQAQPDLIVLDVDMPRLDGFQTLRALKQSGSQTPVVFLSMHAADDIVAEAFRSGGNGYVLKPRVGRDLPTALDEALAGRRFVPSLTSLLAQGDGCIHAMQLHSGGDSFLDGVAALFAAALRQGDATCVIGTPREREGLSDRLCASGWEVGGASGHNRYLAIDAAEALNGFMRDGMPDAHRLTEIAAELDAYRRSVTESGAARLVIFGSMAMMLTLEGNTAAAIALESLWTTLTRDLRFLTLCGYGTACFDAGRAGLWADTCGQHVALSHAQDV